MCVKERLRHSPDRNAKMLCCALHDLKRLGQMFGCLIAKVRSCLPSGARQFSTKLGALIETNRKDAVGFPSTPEIKLTALSTARPRR